MSVLADRDIRAALQEGRIRVDPFDAACLQPSSVDLHLDREFRVFHNHRYPFIDPREEHVLKLIERVEKPRFLILNKIDLVKPKAEETGVAQKLLANSADLDALAAGKRDIAAMQGWRKEVFGDASRVELGNHHVPGAVRLPMTDLHRVSRPAEPAGPKPGSAPDRRSCRCR